MPLNDALSHARFNTYLTWVGHDHEMALRLYTYNIHLCAALGSPLHMLDLEVVTAFAGGLPAQRRTRLINPLASSIRMTKATTTKVSVATF